jgi:hypothetical protein
MREVLRRFNKSAEAGLAPVGIILAGGLALIARSTVPQAYAGAQFIKRFNHPAEP